MSSKDHALQFGQTIALPATAQARGFKNARRIQESFTAAIEKKALIWMAERLPRWINSDHLTGLGLAAMFFAGASYAWAHRSRAGFLLAIFFLALSWFGDSLDGTLARVRNCQRPRYGFYVDHIVDAFGAAFLMIGLAWSGCLHWGVAMGMLIVFLIFSIEVHLATYTLGKFQLSYWKFGPTEIRILLAIGSVKLFVSPWAHLAGHQYLLFDVGGIIAILGMGAMMMVSTVRHTVQLYREERIG